MYDMRDISSDNFINSELHVRVFTCTQVRILIISNVNLSLTVLNWSLNVCNGKLSCGLKCLLFQMLLELMKVKVDKVKCTEKTKLMQQKVLSRIIKL